MDEVRTTQEQLSTHPGMDEVRTTQEQLSTHPLSEVLNAFKRVKKRCCRVLIFTVLE